MAPSGYSISILSILAITAVGPNPSLENILSLTASLQIEWYPPNAVSDSCSSTRTLPSNPFRPGTTDMSAGPAPTKTTSVFMGSRQ